MHQIFAAEVNFQDTPLLVREKFNHSEKNIKRILQAFKKQVDEVYVFANRQRFTVYIVHRNLAPLMEFFHESHHLNGYVQYYYNSGESVTHLMATASGLLSPVKGEARVLAEVAQCYEWASTAGCVGLTLDHAIKCALTAGKAVRTQTAIDQFCVSIVDAGIELLYNRLQDIHRMNFLVVGTGKLAQTALESLTEEGITNVAITGYDEEEAGELAIRYGVKAVKLELLAEYFVHADVVIGVSHEELDNQLLPPFKEDGLRDKGSRIILDFGIPPNFDPDNVGMLAEEFYNLDDLKRLQSSPLECFGGIENAWRMVLKASQDFAFQQQLLQRSPVLNAYLNRQFALKNSDYRPRPKRTLRSMLAFRKSDNLPGTASLESDISMRVQVNNHVADNALDVVKQVTTVKPFSYLMSDN